MKYKLAHYFGPTRSRSREPGPKLQFTGSCQKFRLRAAPPPQHFLQEQNANTLLTKICTCTCIRGRIFVIQIKTYMKTETVKVVRQNKQIYNVGEKVTVLILYGKKLYLLSSDIMVPYCNLVFEIVSFEQPVPFTQWHTVLSIGTGTNKYVKLRYRCFHSGLLSYNT